MEKCHYFSILDIVAASPVSIDDFLKKIIAYFQPATLEYAKVLDQSNNSIVHLQKGEYHIFVGFPDDDIERIRKHFPIVQETSPKTLEELFSETEK